MSFSIRGEDASECASEEFVYCVGKSNWFVVVEAVWVAFLLQKYGKACFPGCRDAFLFIAMCKKKK